MSTESSVTETVVRNHLQAFLEQRGITAILNDYDERARFFSEAKVYQGKQEIHGFFVDFIGSLPAGAYDIFSLRSLRVDGNIVYITWSIGSDVPLGTDTFVVDNGKIVSQTFAMYAVPAQWTSSTYDRPSHKDVPGAPIPHLIRRGCPPRNTRTGPDAADRPVNAPRQGTRPVHSQAHG
jgi:ketosteroid isomerase-like protein